VTSTAGGSASSSLPENNGSIMITW
jgi:hypothetical protein